ncbi:MAG: bifunctional adenosylcobinamide kinase/adenosylcobinamide-phosphate guanylyltransferase [Lentisphaerales bacterium]|nr:bifunctional adenosylcobinamide kinase/adenosylcobinamide-phosphate guanylyltransferase [Lentisphaerales bacterium]
MADIFLITGGCRSGKSSYSEKLALNLPGPHVYLATSPCLDDDMMNRIARHKRDRAGQGWQTVEEEINIAEQISKNDGATILIDCLTLWINNLMWQAEQAGKEISEDDMIVKAEDLVAACQKISGNVVMVTNETGMGIMPINRQARIFADLSGRCNQIIAKAAKKATFMVSGLPMELK